MSTTLRQAISDIRDEYGDSIVIWDNGGNGWLANDLLNEMDCDGPEVVRYETTPRHEAIIRVENGYLRSGEPLFTVRPIAPEGD